MIPALLLAVPGLLAAALVYIQVQDRRIRSWRQARGIITSCHSEARTIHSTVVRNTEFFSEERLATRNFASVAYTFDVDGKSYKGTRIDLSVDPDPDVLATLRRYPTGKPVTIFYDPVDPSQCILERDDPRNIRAGWFAVFVLVALILGGTFGGEMFAAFAAAHVPEPQRLPLVMISVLFALVLAAAARMIGRKGREMRDWPSAKGTIVESAVATTLLETSYGNWSRLRRQTIYVPRVVYRYGIGCRTLDGDNIGAIVKASTPDAAQKRISQFPLGTAVTVFYNPDLETESTLDRSTHYVPIVLYCLSLLCVGAALVAAGYVG